MTAVTIPKILHDMLGESQSRIEIVGVLLTGAGITAAIVMVAGDAFTGLPAWRVLLAVLLVFDIAAGCVANFTRGTDRFYAHRPRNRWVFIAIHVHILVIAVLLGTDVPVALAVWAYTIAAAVVVNLLAGRGVQATVGGLLLAVGLTGIALMTSPGMFSSSIMVAATALYMLKVVYAFAVTHYPERHSETLTVRGR